MRRGVRAICGTLRNGRSRRKICVGVDRSAPTDNDTIQAKVAIPFHAEPADERIVNATARLQREEVELCQTSPGVYIDVLANVCAKQAVIPDP